MTWKEESLSLYQSGKGWLDIAEVIQPKYFPKEKPFGIAERIRSFIRRSPEYNSKNPSKTIEGQSMSSDGTLTSIKFITLAEGEDMTPTRIMKLHGLNPYSWQVVTYNNNMWNTQVKGGILQISYQSKLIVKPLKTSLPTLEEMREVFSELERTGVPKIIPRVHKGHKMAEVNVADLHLGKLCWYGEAPENYDHKIAREVYYTALSDVVDRIRGLGLKYILFVWSNDFFNSDNAEQTTSHGTRQDTDVREKKLYKTGFEMLVQGIEMLKEVAPVKTFYVASNHDEICSFHALLGLSAWFRNDPEVEIEESPYPRKYHLFGKTLIGFTHGASEKAPRLASLMPIEAKEYWSQATTYEMHTAHLHSEHAIQEVNGVIVRRISSPTVADSWHTKSGYIGAVRKIQTFVYDEERGLLDILNTPV